LVAHAAVRAEAPASFLVIWKVREKKRKKCSRKGLKKYYLYLLSGVNLEDPANVDVIDALTSLSLVKTSLLLTVSNKAGFGTGGRVDGYSNPSVTRTSFFLLACKNV